MTMPFYAGLTAAYAKAIYIDGTKKFNEIRSEYVEPVKKHAASNYSLDQIDYALANEYISQEESDETIAYKGL